jgi:hypothetical protein
MRRTTLWIAGAAAVLSLPLCASLVAAQGVPLSTEDLPLAKDLGVPGGLDVTPAFEGWYPNVDGTATIYFGYFNRNEKQVVRVPVGPDNQVTMAGKVVDDAGQPTVFQPRRQYGVFGVQVPGDFKGQVVWALKMHNKTLSVPGSLNPLWKTDQLNGDADGNFGPTLRFQESESGPTAVGPLGLTDPQTLTAKVGEPLQITVWARHDTPPVPNYAEAGGGASTPDAGIPDATGGRGAARGVRVDWVEHAGPGNVSFDPTNGNVPDAGGMATTSATFDTPGTYIVRASAAQGGVARQGNSQCCWTNGFVRVTVTGR